MVIFKKKTNRICQEQDEKKNVEIKIDKKKEDIFT
jgi:hypothetical protein